MNLITSREQAYSALFALLQTIPGIVTVTRRLKHWSEVPQEAQPAAFLQVGNESRTQVRGMPPKYTLNAKVWLYVSTGSDETNAAPAGPILNGLLDALDSILQPPAGFGNPLTLGGLVHNCWIEGETIMLEGDLGTTAVAIVPVLMLAS